MGRARRRRLPRPARRLVVGLGDGGARTRHVLRLLPHDRPVRTGPPDAAVRHSREPRGAARTGAAGQRDDPREPLGRDCSLLSRRALRRPQDQPVARDRSDSERPGSGSAGRAGRHAQRSDALRVRQPVGAAGDERRRRWRVALAALQPGTVGIRRGTVPRGGAGRRRRGARTGRLRRTPRRPGQRRPARRLPAARARHPAGLQSHHGALGFRLTAGSAGGCAAAGHRRRHRRPAAGGRRLEPVVAGSLGPAGRDAGRHAERRLRHRPGHARAAAGRRGAGSQGRWPAASPGSPGTRRPTGRGPRRRSTGNTIRRRTGAASCGTPPPRTRCWR